MSCAGIFNSMKRIASGKFLVTLILMMIFSLQIIISPQDRLQFKHFTSDDGLSQNFISCILQDHQGFMWFGTKDGLNRYDGYNFKVYNYNASDSNSISTNFISVIFEDSKQRLWIGSNTLNLFIRERDAFKKINLHISTINNRVIKNNFNTIISITEDKYHRLWVGTDNGLISYNPDTGSSVTYLFEQDSSTALSDNYISSISTDDSLLIVGSQNGMKLLSLEAINKNKIIIKKISHPVSNNLLTSKRSINTQFRAAPEIIYAGTPSGLVKINLSTNESEFIPYKGIIFSPPWHNRILSICQDKNRNLWLASSGGLFIYHPEGNYFEYNFHDSKVQQSISMNSITSLFADRSGKIWIGTAGKGVNLFDQNKKAFSLYNGFIHKEPFSSDFSISSILSDSNNFLWVSSGQDLYKIDRRAGTYLQVNLLYGEKGEITSIVEDRGKNIWVSSSGGLYKISGKDERITFYNHIPSNSNSLRDNFVKLLFIDRVGNLFILNSNYLSEFIPEKNSFRNYELRFTKNDFSENLPVTIKNIYQAADGQFWFACSNGLVKYNLHTEDLKIYKHIDGEGINNDEILSICEDPVEPDKYLWLGTQGGGLNRFNIEEETFTIFTVENGLPNNVVYGILSFDDELWFSTNNGLCRTKIDKYGMPSFRNYDVSDGLQGNEFNTGAYFKSSSGELFFGGLKGVTAFYPSEIRDNVYVPPLAFTKLLFLKEEDTGSESNPGINIINNNPVITIPYSQNSFTIQFAALDFTATKKNKYKYKLSPVSEDWINLGTQHSVTLTELAEGEYNLTVIGSNNDGVWNDKGTSLQIIISPPFWRTNWAYGLYIIIFAGILYALRHYELNRINLKNRLRQEHFETKKLKELDALKSDFFANISHEFRTPLTLILGPAEQLDLNESDPGKKEKLQLIKKSSNRLLRLINQILDLSKLEKNKVKLNPEKGELVGFLRDITLSFLSIAEKKNITLNFRNDSKEILTYFDRDLTEKIFYNLISNAIKFTLVGGIVEIRISKNYSNKTDNTVDGYCRISIKDSGIGIDKKELPAIFDKFYVSKTSGEIKEHGSGIGLSLVKELVELINGRITVESELNKGSNFIVYFPITTEFFDSNSVEFLAKESEYLLNNKTAEQIIDTFTPVQEELVNSENGKDDSIIILIIEDNSDLRTFIKSQLQNYQTIEAVNGSEGLKKAFEVIPDLVISDVMMPEMDGFKFCEKIKNDERTSHIPVILLTARAGESDKINGLESGADDYLTKPFSSQELLVRVKNLIEIRQRLRKKFSNILQIKPKEIATNSIDKQFLEKAVGIVEKYMSDERFTVLTLSNEMNLSHSQLHRKLKALVNQSAIQFIRSLRMQRALELIKNNTGNIAEISYQVGFSDPSYFTKTFSKYFGYLPSDVNNKD